MFINILRNSEESNGEFIVKSKELFNDTDSAYQEFWIRFLKLDSNNEQSQSQMFKQFHTLLSSKETEDGSFDEEENYMVNQFNSALEKANTSIMKPPIKVVLEPLVVEEVKSVPFGRDTLVKLFSSETI
jgi:hypothetical protein